MLYIHAFCRVYHPSWVLSSISSWSMICHDLPLLFTVWSFARTLWPMIKSQDDPKNGLPSVFASWNFPSLGSIHQVQLKNMVDGRNSAPIWGLERFSHYLQGFHSTTIPSNPVVVNPWALRWSKLREATPTWYLARLEQLWPLMRLHGVQKLYLCNSGSQ